MKHQEKFFLNVVNCAQSKTYKSEGFLYVLGKIPVCDNADMLSLSKYNVVCCYRHYKLYESI